MSFNPINPFGRSVVPPSSPATAPAAPSVPSKTDAGPFARREGVAVAKGSGPARPSGVSSDLRSGTSENVASLIKDQQFEKVLAQIVPENARDVLKDGGTLLHCLVATPWTGPAREIADNLVRWGAKINAPTPDGKTPLVKACESTNGAAVLFLAGHNAALNPAS